MLSAEGRCADPCMTVQIHRAARDTGGIAGQRCEYRQRKRQQLIIEHTGKKTLP